MNENDQKSEILKDIFIEFAKKNRDVFWVRNVDYKKQLYISPAFEKIWGRNGEDLYKHPEKWEAFLHPEDREKLEESIKQRNPGISPQSSFLEYYRIIRPDNEIRWIRDLSFPIYDKNRKHIAFAGIAQDITADKLYEQQLELAKEKAEAANKAKQEFLYNMRHDIRTPFSGILGLAQLIADNESDPQKRQDLKAIAESAQCLLDYFNEILEFMQIESGMVPILAKRFSLSDLIDDIIATLKPAALEKNLELIKQYDAPQFVIGDSFRIHRILINLLGNAVKFTSKGHIILSISAVKKTDQEFILKISVQDTGIGISEEKYNVIFERFNRLTASYTGIYKGPGLGLRAVKQILDELGGEIQVKSEINKGSLFTCFIPLKLPLLENYDDAWLTYNPGENKQKNITKEPEVTASYEAHILLVEDDPIAHQISRYNLEKFHCAVDWAPNAQVALSLSEEIEYDLILMDLGLPDMEGDMATWKIRQLNNPHYQNIPIIGLTAHADEAKKRRCLEQGMNDVLLKPLTDEITQKILCKWLNSNKANLPIIDLNLGIKLAGSAHGAKEMLALLVGSLPNEKAAIQAAIHQKDWGQLQFLIHKLHGGCCYCGVPRIKELLKSTELALKAEDIKQANSLCSELLVQIDVLLQEYENFNFD